MSGRRVVIVHAVLSSPDNATDAELETLAQDAINETYLDIEECSITLGYWSGGSATPDVPA